jgi:CRISP-associated protein Cas1
MLQLPDFKEKQIVFIQASRQKMNSLRFKNDNLVFCIDEKIENQVSCHKVIAIFIQGDISITSVLIRKALEYGISIFFLTYNLRLYASINAIAEGNTLLRYNQYHFEKDIICSRNLVKNKCLNQLTLIKEVNPNFFKGTTRLRLYNEIANKIDKAVSLDEILGLEGSFAKKYFKAVFDDTGWYRRMPRTKVDMTNLLMDMGYTMLFNYIDALLKLHGFDTYKGIYHQLFFQRKSLTCDLIEPFRVIIDKALIKAYRLKQINEKDFKKQGEGLLLKYAASKSYSRFLLEAIIVEKEEIFSYIKKHYFCVLNKTDDFPVFKYQSPK